MAWQTNDCPLNAGVKQDRRMSQTGFTPLDSGGCKPVNVSHHRNCPPVSLKHERDTLAQRAKTGQIIDTSNSASAGKRRAEHYCPRPLIDRPAVVAPRLVGLDDGKDNATAAEWRHLSSRDPPSRSDATPKDQRRGFGSRWLRRGALR
ncbi:hypothetical protein RB9809 [Rhodopirellula baltica SH 1]|uniref:Uncharacterized protein n=1 Tax=Rhodopirellula baltica (strain DSM 10527 / NCIMB 13988 / SH1) TaxID=243090 RepID=Q7UL09_RHOBA|nr:hypothetical protein RB9809 [Rhodopirellula baltica SH 1]